jgi:hypothetical protein
MLEDCVVGGLLMRNKAEHKSVAGKAVNVGRRRYPWTVVAITDRRVDS